MAMIDAMPPGLWKGPPLLLSGRTSVGGLGIVRFRRGVNGERMQFIISSLAGQGGAQERIWTGDLSSGGEGGTRGNSVVNNKGWHQNNLCRENGFDEQSSLTSTSVEESTSRSGRRTFSTLSLMAVVVFPFSGKIAEGLAEETQTKPEKKKGRAPSSPYDEDRLLEQNRRMQRLNNAPTEFPGFVREGFQVKVITTDKYVSTKSGLMYYDMVIGNGDLPQDGQQVIFHYTGYNESGRRVDSSYQQGRPARTRLGIQGMIPGFEEGIKTMRAGGRRIIIVPPELGPPVGPSTFFSAKQFEVFDVELLEAKDCSRRTLLFYSDVVCK